MTNPVKKLKDLDKEFTARGVDVEAAKRVIILVGRFNVWLIRRKLGSAIFIMRGINGREKQKL